LPPAVVRAASKIRRGGRVLAERDIAW